MRLSGNFLQSESICIYQKWHLHKFAVNIKRWRKRAGREREGVKFDLQSGLLLMYDCSDAEATTAGPTASICLSVYLSQRKLEPSIFFFFKTAWHFSMVWYFLHYVIWTNVRHSYNLSISFHYCILYASLPLPGTISSPFCFSCRKEIQFNDHVYRNTDVTWSDIVRLYQCFRFEPERRIYLEFLFMSPFWENCISIKSSWWHVGRKTDLSKHSINRQLCCSALAVIGSMILTMIVK